MANGEHIDLLKHDVAMWNEWRTQRRIRPDLRGADLHEVDLRRANLAEADLAWSNLEDANLAGADLGGATLMGAVMERACLLGANIAWADCSGADLADSVLRGARFTGTDCCGVDFSGSNAKSVRVMESNGSAGRTDLTGARNLKQMQIDTMSGDTGVLLAGGLAHPCHWPDWHPEGTAEPRSKQSYVLSRPEDRQTGVQL